MLYTRLDIFFVVGMVSRYWSSLGLENWMVVKNILKYLRKTRYYMHGFQSDELVSIRYTNSDFQTNKDSH